jgi:hypothetical protein
VYTPLIQENQSFGKQLLTISVISNVLYILGNLKKIAHALCVVVILNQNLKLNMSPLVVLIKRQVVIIGPLMENVKIILIICYNTVD